MHIRRLSPLDATAYQALRLRALSDEPNSFGSSYEEEASTAIETVAGRIQTAPDGAIYGAFVNSVLVGVVGIGREGMLKLRHKAFLWGMYVAPEYRSKGVARALLKEALAFSKESIAARKVTLYVNAANNPAVSLYRSMGFETYGTEQEAMCVNGIYQTELLMSCRNVAA